MSLCIWSFHVLKSVRLILGQQQWAKGTLKVFLGTKSSEYFWWKRGFCIYLSGSVWHPANGLLYSPLRSCRFTFACCQPGQRAEVSAVQPTTSHTHNTHINAYTRAFRYTDESNCAVSSDSCSPERRAS